MSFMCYLIVIILFMCMIMLSYNNMKYELVELVVQLSL